MPGVSLLQREHVGDIEFSTRPAWSLTKDLALLKEPAPANLSRILWAIRIAISNQARKRGVQAITLC
jgi:hypothetical protein